MNMVPRAKKEKYFDNTMRINRDLKFSSCKYEEKIKNLIEILFPGTEAQCAEDGILNILFVSELNSEDYILDIALDRITITVSDYMGVRNSIASLSNLANENFEFPICHIIDGPSSKHRGIMIDLARGVEKIEKLKEDIILCAKAKLNYIHLHFFDSQGSAIKIKSFPKSAYVDNAYTVCQVKELVEFCDILGIDVIPEFDLPAHSRKLIGAYPELACDTDNPNQTPWIVCAGEEKLIGFYERVISELTEIFKSKYFHIGGDEIEFRDRPEINQLCHWDECRKCQAYMKKHNITNRQDLFYDVILRVYKTVKDAGKTMIMWSDQLDCNRDIPLPRDIIMQFWRVAGKGRGPWENCSMNAQLKAGFKVINSYFRETYVDLECYVNSEKLKNWDFYISPESDEDVRENIIGSEMCAWEYGNHLRYPHYAYSLPSAIVLMGDKLWNRDSLPYSDRYEELVTRTIMGIESPKGLNIFKCIGDILPPRTDERIYKEKVKCSEDEINSVLETLMDMKNNIRADAYYACIKEGMEMNGPVNIVESIE